MKILTSPSSMGQVGNQPFEILIKSGYEIINNPFGRKLTENEVIELAQDCIGIIAGVEPLTSKVMNALPNLKCISRVGVGMDNVDLEYAKKRGIIVVNTPDGPTRSVAEMTLAMAFSLLRKIPQADANIKRGVWKKETGNLLFEKRIGIVGLGRIGKLVAEIFRKLGNEVIGYDLFPDNAWANNTGVRFVDMEELFREADIISIHVPPNKDKSFVVGSQLLSVTKPQAFVLNAARGGVIDEDYLYDMLQSNKIAGAAIDVFSTEPYNGPFTKLNNVVLTPHLGSYAAEGKLQMEIDAVNNLLKALENEK